MIVRLLFALALLLGFASTAAASCTSTGYIGSYICSTPQEAKDAADASMTVTCAGQNDIGTKPTALDWSSHGIPGHPSLHDGFVGGINNPANWNCGTPGDQWSGIIYMYETPTCPAGKVFDKNTGQCETDCTQAPPGGEGLINGALYSGGVCSGGCQMRRADDPEFDKTARNVQMQSINIRRVTWVPTGQRCTTEPPQPPENDKPCLDLGGGYSLCVGPDGNCILSAATGKQYCPSDAGPTTDPTRKEAVTQSLPNTPAQPPANREGENWQTVNNSSVTNNNSNTTVNYNISNNSGVGNTGAPVPGDGSGTGSGTGTGDGEGEGQGQTPTTQTYGDHYTEGDFQSGLDAKVEARFAAYWAAVQTVPIMAKINFFFGNCAYSGTCPSMVYENEYMGHINFSQMCDGTMAVIFAAAGWVVMALGAFGGFRIAIY